ncbi:hypothetical protein [Paenibacillus sp. QZ-Y1]|uniref:hypothetical protein n=1 Tax=Paenibacillus sp. QZ-Y1 TaxID=3414511 RepID=UPI003F7A96FD
MPKKILTSLLMVALMGMISVPVTGTSMTTTVAESYEISGETLPDNLRYDSEHPDIIYVKDCGVFKKVDSSVVDYSEEVVVDDIQKVTDQTNVIVAYDATYIKKGEWE